MAAWDTTSGQICFSETNVLSIRVRFGSCKNPRIGHEVFMSLGDKCLSMRCLCTPWILVFVCNSHSQRLRLMHVEWYILYRLVVVLELDIQVVGRGWRGQVVLSVLCKNEKMECIC